MGEATGPEATISLTLHRDGGIIHAQVCKQCAASMRKFGWE